MEVCSQHSNIVITNRYNRTAKSIEKFCSGCKSIPKEITIIEKKANDNQNLNDTQTFAKNIDKDETVENSEKSKVNINQNINNDKLVCDKHPEQKLTYHFNRTEQKGYLICPNPSCKRAIGFSDNFDNYIDSISKNT